MSRKRLTREGSRERTTQRLLAAARKLIAKRGLSDTTLDEISEEAGYTRGAFYSNFSGKGDLFIELLRRDHEATSARLRALRDDSLPLEHIQQRIREIYTSLLEGVKLAMLSSPRNMTFEDAESVLALFVNSLMRAARTLGEEKRNRSEGGSRAGDSSHE